MTRQRRPQAESMSLTPIGPRFEEISADCRAPRKLSFTPFSNAVACELYAPCFSIDSAPYTYQKRPLTRTALVR